MGQEKVAWVKQRAARDPGKTEGRTRRLHLDHIHALVLVQQGVYTERGVSGGMFQQSGVIGFFQHFLCLNCFVNAFFLCPPLLMATDELELKLPPEMTPPFLEGPRLLLVNCRQLPFSHWPTHYGSSVPGSGDGNVNMSWGGNLEIFLS